MTSPDSLAIRTTRHMNTEELRSEYLTAGLFVPGEVRLRGWEVDRTIVGGITPTSQPLELPIPAELRAGSFFERREAGVMNLGGPGRITIGNEHHELSHLDALYIGRGASKQISLESHDADKPARFYLLSYPAHASYPTRLVRFSETKGDKLGARETANERTLTKMIHAGAFPTCQVVMGVTQLEAGSVWNTMPAHTHLRRSEVYLYFNVQPNHAVFHLMGQPKESRHIVVRDGEAVLSPPWSIHSGVGTSAYSFVWGMGGENQEFTDMDPAPVSEIR